MRQEAQQEQAWRERQQRRARVLLISAVVVAGIGLLLIALGVAASVRSNREEGFGLFCIHTIDNSDMT